MKNNLRFLLFIIPSILLTLNSCLKQDFDAPPSQTGYDPNLPVNMSIASLKTKIVTAGDPVRIDSNWTVYGIVTADDRSGNFYKQIVIEDSTGGINVLIDGTSLYSKYPIGRKIYLKLQGLYFGKYGGLAQIGSTPDNTGAITNISTAKADSVLVKANFPNTVPNHNFTDLSQLKTLNSAMLNRIVTIQGVQVVSTDTTKTYAQPPSVSSGTNINIEDCSKNKIIIRTSGYANFSTYKVPKGKGTLTAVYTVYNGTPQLVIRDTDDLKFYDDRCNATVPMLTIDSMRKLYPGSGTITLGSAMVTGVVISDLANGNISSGNFILEDGSKKGVILYISGGGYNLGDSLLIDVSGGTLQLYPTTGVGSLELKVSSSAVTKVGTLKTVAPIVITIADLNANFSNYESTLVQINNASVPAGTYSGNKTMTDLSSGSILLYTSTGAAFASQTVWTGAKTVTGIATPYSSNEIKLRNPAIDVK